VMAGLSMEATKAAMAELNPIGATSLPCHAHCASVMGGSLPDGRNRHITTAPLYSVVSPGVVPRRLEIRDRAIESRLAGSRCEFASAPVADALWNLCCGFVAGVAFPEQAFRACAMGNGDRNLSA
jgi:hypothetical protein